MSMVCERGGGEGKRRILVGQSVPPPPFGMAFGRLKLSTEFVFEISPIPVQCCRWRHSHPASPDRRGRSDNRATGGGTCTGTLHINYIENQFHTYILYRYRKKNEPEIPCASVVDPKLFFRIRIPFEPVFGIRFRIRILFD
jgi:hypothetical protein